MSRSKKKKMGSITSPIRWVREVEPVPNWRYNKKNHRRTVSYTYEPTSYLTCYVYSDSDSGYHWTVRVSDQSYMRFRRHAPNVFLSSMGTRPIRQAKNECLAAGFMTLVALVFAGMPGDDIGNVGRHK